MHPTPSGRCRCARCSPAGCAVRRTPPPVRRSGCTPPITTPMPALARGRALRAEVDATADPVGVLVVADGANTLTPPAPGGYDPDAEPVQAALDDALASGDTAALAALAGLRRRPGRLPGAGRAGRPRPTLGQGTRARRALRGGVLRRRLDAVTGGLERSDSGRRPRPIAVIGPTGTGKSALALEVAERLGGEIVNADAMQQYRGMDIGTAKLSAGERRGIPHHQLDVLDVTETATVARYQQAAVADVEAIAARGAVPVIVGGSMMYIQSLLDDWAFPATDAGGAGPLGGAAGRDRRGRPARRTGRPRSCRRGGDPGHRRPTDRARPGGGRAHRPAVRRVGPADRRARDGTPSSSG